MVSERGKGKGKVGQRSSSRNAGQAAEIVAPDVVPTSAAVLTLASVQPLPAPPAEHDAGALEASLTLASLSMPVLAAGVLGPGQVAQLPGSPGTRADIPAGAESTAEQDKEEQRKKAQAARKRRQRENERAVAQVTSPTTASAALAATTPTSASVVEKAHHASPRCSPRKSQVPPAAAATGNWSAFCDVRMVLAAISSVMEPLLKLLGHPADRQELQGSSSDNKCDPTHAFFEQLAVIFNDVNFLPVVPAGWDTHNHLKKKVYAARYARDASFLQAKWNACRARVEVATRRYSGVSGTDALSCFCGCGSLGFFSTSGYQSIHANKLSRDDNVDTNGTKLCVAPAAHAGVYMWYLAMQNNDLMNQKGSVAIPAAVRHQGLVGSAGAYVKHHKTSRKPAAKHTADVETVSDSESDSSLVKNKKRNQKATPHDHSGATLTC